MTGTPGASRRVVAVIGGGIAGLSAAWELTGGATALPDAERPLVLVLDAGGTPGGKLRTEAFHGQMVDRGPDAFLARRPEATGLVSELGIDDLLLPVGTTTASLWIGGRLRPMPGGLALGIPTRLLPLARSHVLSPPGLARAGSDLLGRRGAMTVRDAGGIEDRSVGDLVGRALGREVVERLADPLIGGINASSVADMSAAMVFPPLLEAASRPGSLMRNLREVSPAPGQPREASGKAPGSPAGGGSGSGTGPAAASPPIFWSLRGGMGALPEALARRLTERGALLVGGATARGLRREGDQWVVDGDGDAPGAGAAAPPIEAAGAGRWTATVDGVVLACPTGTAGDLLAPHAPEAAALLRHMSYASVAVATFTFRAGAIGRSPAGSGVLVPRTSRLGPAVGAGRGEPPLVTACTWLSSKWPHLARPGEVLVRASAGRLGDERFAALDDDELVRRLLEEIRPILELSGAPIESAVTRWPDALPQYPVGHLTRVAAVEKGVAALPAVAMAGAAFHGVGIPACIGSGRRAGCSVLQALSRP